MRKIEVKRSWKATIIMLAIIIALGSWGMVYSKSIGADGQVYGCLIGMVIGVFVTVSQLCPEDK